MPLEEVKLIQLATSQWRPTCFAREFELCGLGLRAPEAARVPLRVGEIATSILLVRGEQLFRLAAADAHAAQDARDPLARSSAQHLPVRSHRQELHSPMPR